MLKRACLLALLVGLATPAQAQFVVFDPTNFAQTVLIAERTQRHYTELMAQYQTILRMARGLGSLDPYRIPAIALTGHDLGRWQYGRPWLAGLNSGDARGDLFWSTTLPLERPLNLPATLTAAARRQLERQYATIEITDSVAMMGAPS